MDALIVAYSFPPVGGAGVARVLKLVKYLPMHGVRPTVLTVSNPSVPVEDRSRDRDLAPDLEVLRARTFEPGYAAKAAAQASQVTGKPSMVGRLKRLAAQAARAALVPDAQVLWQPAAQLALARRLYQQRPDVVFISGPPFSAFLLAPLARLAPGVGVVLDYRDEWSTWRTTYENASRAAAVIGAPLERALAHRAHVITTATSAFRTSLLHDIPGLDPARVHAIPNGYDLDDLPGEGTTARLPSDKLVITYAGTIFKLTSAQGLMGAVRRLHREHPDLARFLELRFYGRVVDAELAHFADVPGVTLHGYVPHGDVGRALTESHIVLCLLDDVPGAERIYPAKIFELMAMARPVLTLAPPGELATLVTEQGLGELVGPRDETAIAHLLERHLRRFVDGRMPVATPARDAARYDRRALAGDFARAFAQAKKLA
jgi:glycosyltransferase involved in cell wall biosynthesis